MPPPIPSWTLHVCSAHVLHPANGLSLWVTTLLCTYRQREALVLSRSCLSRKWGLDCVSLASQADAGHYPYCRVRRSRGKAYRSQELRIYFAHKMMDKGAVVAPYRAVLSRLACPHLRGRHLSVVQSLPEALCTKVPVLC